MKSTTLIILYILLSWSVKGQYLADNGPKYDIERIYQAGERAYRAGDLPLAIDLFTTVLVNDPEHINAYLQRGFSYSMNKNYELAVKDFSAVISRKPDHLWAYTSRGSALNRLDRHAEAIRDFDAVLALDARNEEAYNNRGWAYKAQGDLEAACKDWRYSQRLGNSEAKIILSNTRCK